jgi:hypothetical protein
MQEILCKDCGGHAEIEKMCGDNGSNFNGVQFRLECQGCGKSTKFYKSQFVAITEWEEINQNPGLKE